MDEGFGSSVAGSSEIIEGNLHNFYSRNTGFFLVFWGNKLGDLFWNFRRTFYGRLFCLISWRNFLGRIFLGEFSWKIFRRIFLLNFLRQFSWKDFQRSFDGRLFLVNFLVNCLKEFSEDFRVTFFGGLFSKICWGKILGRKFCNFKNS